MVKKKILTELRKAITDIDIIISGGVKGNFQDISKTELDNILKIKDNVLKKVYDKMINHALEPIDSTDLNDGTESQTLIK